MNSLYPGRDPEEQFVSRTLILINSSYPGRDPDEQFISET